MDSEKQIYVDRGFEYVLSHDGNGHAVSMIMELLTRGRFSVLVWSDCKGTITFAKIHQLHV